MVVSLKPGKFYGSSLPRPRYYTDIKFNDERVDPPVPVLDPLMSWAEEAHWSMGGLSFNRLRLQGKIEGNVNKLKKEREVTWKKKMENSTPESKSGVGYRGLKAGGSGVSPPPALISKKRRQRKNLDDLEDEEEFDDEYDSEEEEIEVEIQKKVGKNEGMKKKRRRLVRKLGDDFELVGAENGKSPLKDSSNDGVPKGVASRTRTQIRSRRTMVLKDEEDDCDNDDEITSKGKKNGVENGKIEKSKEKNASVTPKRNGGKGSVSPSGSRSSPRLKQKSS